MSIIDVIQAKYPSFRVPVGNGWVPVRCPFHADATSSASVNVDIDRFKCHGCSVSGDSKSLGQLLGTSVMPTDKPVGASEPHSGGWEPALTKDQRTELLAASKRYASWLPGSPAESLLHRRELRHTLEFGFGFVREPMPGHDRYTGMMSIPYIRKTPVGVHVVGIRFRCVEDHVCKEQTPRHPKYLSTTKNRLYNTAAVFSARLCIGITEGELDAVAAETRLGLPSCGISGAQAWNPDWAPLFVGFDRVYVFEDGDDSGTEFGDKVTRGMVNAVRVRCPDGEDVESWTRKGFGFDIDLGE